MHLGWNEFITKRGSKETNFVQKQQVFRRFQRLFVVVAERMCNARPEFEEPKVTCQQLVALHEMKGKEDRSKIILI